MIGTKYVLIAFLVIFLVFISYIINFYLILGYTVSNDTAVWGQLGDYIGGLLNPTLSFISLVLLIKSLTLQNEANSDLRKELKNSEKTEKLRSFETLFFNMLNSQKELFNSFSVDLSQNNLKIIKNSVEAVIAIEDEIANIRELGGCDTEIKELINKLDYKDQIFGLTRAFYIIVKIITDKLNDSEGFSSEDRKSHLHTLINFTEFSQLRMIMIGIQFTEFESVKYLKDHSEFLVVLQEVGVGFDLY